MYSDLIIGFDGSPPAYDALAFGRRLALATGARPCVLYVRPYAPLSLDVADDAEDVAWAADVAAVLDEMRALMRDVPGTTISGIADTSPARAMHRVAEEVDAALIVLGATHRTGLGRVIPGTTAESVIHAAPCAVAIAPAGYADRPEARPFGLIAAAVDGGDESERVAHVGARIARGAGGALRLITVVERPYTHGPLHAGTLGYASLADVVRESETELLERMARGAGAEIGTEIERCVAEGHVAEQVALHSEDVDLLVIGSRGYGPLRRVVVGSATGKILEAVTCPVLVVPRRTADEVDDAIVPLAAATVGAGASDPAPEEAGVDG